jgi:hypothetical protein
MCRDEDLQPIVTIEEWLVVLRGPADLDAERLAVARDLVTAALAALAGALEAELAALGVQLEVATE